VVCSDKRQKYLCRFLFLLLRADCLESKVTSESDLSIYVFGYPRASRRRL